MKNIRENIQRNTSFLFFFFWPLYECWRIIMEHLLPSFVHIINDEEYLWNTCPFFLPTLLMMKNIHGTLVAFFCFDHFMNSEEHSRNTRYFFLSTQRILKIFMALFTRWAIFMEKIAVFFTRMKTIHENIGFQILCDLKIKIKHVKRLSYKLKNSEIWIQFEWKKSVDMPWESRS